MSSTLSGGQHDRGACGGAGAGGLMAALLALDPGLDECGYAVLGFGGAPHATAQVFQVHPLLDVGTWYCPSGAELEVRLRRHAEEVIRVLSGHGDAITHAVIERPITSTVYAAHRTGGPRQQTKMAASREVQELVTGVLWRTLEARGVTAHFAAPTRKTFRSLDVLRRLYPDLPRTSEHARAALALGLAALADHRRHWAA